MRPPRDRTAARQTIDPVRRTEADRHLQSEIDKAILGLVGGVPLLSGWRLARVLGAVLEPSWSEHTSYQDEALFPIIARAAGSTREIHALLARLGREHAEIGKHQHEVSLILHGLVASRYAVNPAQGDYLLQTLELRRRHHEAETVLEELIPAALDPADRASLERWIDSRATPPFPVNLVFAFWE